MDNRILGDRDLSALSLADKDAIIAELTRIAGESERRWISITSGQAGRQVEPPLDVVPKLGSVHCLN